MGRPVTNGSQDEDRQQPSHTLTVTGLGTAWPSRLVGPEVLESYVEKLYDPKQVAMSKLLNINRKTGIKTRAVLDIFDQDAYTRAEPPKMEVLDDLFRDHGVALTEQACRKAIAEWGGSISDITHTVAVTATNAGAPGYDQLVGKRLGLKQKVEQTLISGAGCSGGLAALRAASRIASSASYYKQPARVLLFATEICSIQMRSELEVVKAKNETLIGPALFGDGASALIICNEFAPEARSKGIYAIRDWVEAAMPNTDDDATYLPTSMGFLLHLSKQVPANAGHGCQVALEELSRRHPELSKDDAEMAVHPGGAAVVKACQEALDISDHSLRATWDIYENRGNIAGMTVLAILDRLRDMGSMKEDVVAASFGPGMTVEMALLKYLG